MVLSAVVFLRWCVHPRLRFRLMVKLGKIFENVKYFRIKDLAYGDRVCTNQAAPKTIEEMIAMQKRQRSESADGSGESSADNPTLAEVAYRQLRREIVAGVFEPGQKLRLEVLRARYGLSFSPLREALNRLQGERLVTSIALRGFSVAPFSIAEMWDVVETRILIECEALRRSILMGGDDWEAAIVATFHALSLKTRRLAEAEPEAAAEARDAVESSHREFHSALIAACGSPRLLDLADTLYTQTERYRCPTLVGRGGERPKRRVVKEHRDIMDAVLARKAALATERLAGHYRHTAQLVEATLTPSVSVLKLLWLRKLVIPAKYSASRDPEDIDLLQSKALSRLVAALRPG